MHCSVAQEVQRWQLLKDTSAKATYKQEAETLYNILLMEGKR